jgi:hypothetical protein
MEVSGRLHDPAALPPEKGMGYVKSGCFANQQEGDFSWSSYYFQQPSCGEITENDIGLTG